MEEKNEIYEILTWGPIAVEFKRLEIHAKQTYFRRGKDGALDFGVYEVTAVEYLRLVNDPADQTHWFHANAGWRYAVGSNLGPVNKRFNINGRYLKAWAVDNWTYPGKFKNLAAYLENAVGATTGRNVTACYACLAKQNGLKISELLETLWRPLKQGYLIESLPKF